MAEAGPAAGDPLARPRTSRPKLLRPWSLRTAWSGSTHPVVFAAVVRAVEVFAHRPQS